jgi:hypothetical protein
MQARTSAWGRLPPPTASSLKFRFSVDERPTCLTRSDSAACTRPCARPTAPVWGSAEHVLAEGKFGLGGPCLGPLCQGMDAFGSAPDRLAPFRRPYGVPMDGRGFRRVAVEFESEDAVLRGFLYEAVIGEPPFPLVVMAHGTSATIPMVVDRYAEVFAEAGVSALVYDHRNLGISGGEPRQEINPWVQCRGYRDAITFASTITYHDPNRIGVWGDSYSAGQVYVVAACDSRVKVVVAQCPVFGAEPPSVDPTREVFEAIRETLESGDVSGEPADKTGPIPVVSSDQLGTPSLLQPIQAYRWFIDYGGRPGSGWHNQATRVTPSNTALYSPYLCAPYVTVPSLMMVASADEMVHANPMVSRRAFELLAGEKDWFDLEGGHFGLLYHPSELFDQASRVQADYLARHLL